jgi:hypothetical protein
MLPIPPDFDPRAVAEQLAMREPQVWQRCYPRIYEEPSRCGRFYSAKEVGFQLLSTALRIKMEGMGGVGQSQIAELIWASRLASLRVPTYWIGRDMAQAIQQTVPPMEFDWSTEKLPFDAMAFMVPRGVLVHEEKREGEATFVSFVRVRKGDEVASLSTAGPRFYDIMEDAFSCFACTSSETLMHWTFAREESFTKVNLAELDRLVQDFAKYNHVTYSRFSSDLTMADNRFMARVSHFVFGTILLMLTKPEYVTSASLRKRVPAKADKAPKEFWFPNVVGLHYHIRREGGTHASPRIHWVRGAYKEQPYGERHALRKRIWVEPYLRGVDDGKEPQRQPRGAAEARPGGVREEGGAQGG